MMAKTQSIKDFIMHSNHEMAFQNLSFYVNCYKEKMMIKLSEEDKTNLILGEAPAKKEEDLNIDL